DYSSRLHDYYFKELRSHPHRASALYQNKTKWPCPIFVFNYPGIAPEPLVSPIRECKGRQLFRIRKIYFKKDQNTFAKPQKPHVNRLKPGIPPLRSGAKIEQIPTPRNSSTQIKSHNPDILTNKIKGEGVGSIFMAPFSIKK